MICRKKWKRKDDIFKFTDGNYEYRGKITSSVLFDYFPYPVKEPDRWTMEVLREVCPQAKEWQIRKELYALFLKEGHFLLIDEPTNHLDGCVDHILSLNRSNIEIQSGTFSSFLENFERQQKMEEVQNESLKKDIRRLKQVARQQKAIEQKSRLIISYVPQDTSHLQGILSEFAGQNQIEESLFKAILRKLAFERGQFEKGIQDFSGGQKKKVLIAKSLCEQAHLYVWD